jgi:glyceraldehyde 3-phosphate dehydrogenase
MPDKIKIGINGFGRIGRNLFRLLIDHPTIEVAVINDIADAPTLSHLLKYDSIHGKLNREILPGNNAITIEQKEIPVTNFSRPRDINWNRYGVQIVIESSGKIQKL